MTFEINRINPPEMGAPLGLYRQISRVRASEHIFIAGQLSVDRSGAVVGKGNFDAQMQQVFTNIETALTSMQCTFANVVKFTTYLVHAQDIELFMAARKKMFSKLFPNGDYPPNTLLVVDRLVQEDFLIEVDTMAAL